MYKKNDGINNEWIKEQYENERIREWNTYKGLKEKIKTEYRKKMNNGINGELSEKLIRN